MLLPVQYQDRGPYRNVAYILYTFSDQPLCILANLTLNLIPLFPKNILKNK